jgi:hypothetical protein
MARKYSNDPLAYARALEVVKSASDLDEVRAAQAYLLPVMGIPTEQVQAIIGRDRYWIARARNRFLKGLPAINRQHGGRRNQVLSQEEEANLVKAAFRRASTLRRQGHRLPIRECLRDLLDQKAARSVSEATVTGMLQRVLTPYVGQHNLAYLWRIEHPLELLFLAEEDIASRHEMKNEIG